MQHSSTSFFRQGNPGKKLPVFQGTDFDTPSFNSPFFIDKYHWTYPLSSVHVHTGVEIESFYAGKGQFYRNGAYWDIEAGDCYFTNALQPHFCGASPDSPIDLVYVHVSTAAIMSICPPEQSLKLLSLFFFRYPDLSPVIIDQKQVGKLLLEAYHEFISESRFARIKAWIKVVEALTVIADRIYCELEKKDKDIVINHAKMLDAISFIHEHFNEPLTVEQIARQCNKSPSHFAHAFSNILKVSPIDYRNSVRIEHAVEQLVTSDKKIETISFECGFESFSNFRHSFKKITGVSPLDFRQKSII